MQIAGNPDWERLVDEHRKWLTPFERVYQQNWERLYRSDPEAALLEAAVRRFLQVRDVTVAPNESPIGSEQRPDFRCAVRNYLFYVDATCVKTDTATRVTGISPDEVGFLPFNPVGMMRASFNKLQSKGTQSGNLDAPSLVAVGTFHGIAGSVGFKKPVAEWALTGIGKIAWDVSTNGNDTGEAYTSTELEFAPFVRLDPSNSLTTALESISGVLLCGLGTEPSSCIGLLNPNAVRPFDPSHLPSIEFATLTIDTQMNRLSVEWLLRNSEAK